MFLWGHGLLSSMAAEDAVRVFDWSGVVDDGWRLVRYDARGHGDSPGDNRPASYHWTDLSNDQLDLIDGTAVIGGASMGAATALTTAADAPDRVRGLVLCIPPTAWETRPRQVRVYRLGARLAGALGGGGFEVLSRFAPVPPALAGHNMRELLSVSAMPRARLAAILRGAAESDLPDPDELARLTMPTLILAWTGDASHPISTAERLHDLIDGSELQVAECSEDLDTWPALSGHSSPPCDPPGASAANEQRE